MNPFDTDKFKELAKKVLGHKDSLPDFPNWLIDDRSNRELAGGPLRTVQQAADRRRKFAPLYEERKMSMRPENRPSAQTSSTSKDKPSKELSEIERLLQAFSGTEMPEYDPEAYRKQATSIVNQRFNPQIEAIRGMMQETKGRAKQNSKKLDTMYDALARSMGKDAKSLRRSYSKSTKQTKNEYKNLSKNVAKNYKGSRDDYLEELKSLGIEAAAPETLKGFLEDETFTKNQAARQGQVATDAMRLQGKGAVNYAKGNRAAARFEGQEVQDSMMQDLESMLGQYGSQLSGVRGEKGAALQEIMMGLADKSYDRDASAMQFNNDNNWKMLDYLTQQQNAAAEAAASQQDDDVKYDKRLGAAAYLRDNLGTAKAEQAEGIINRILATKSAQAGQFSMDGEVFDMTPERLAVMARKEARRRGHTNPDFMNALVDALYAMYGKLE